MNLDKFNWGKSTEWYRDFIGKEIFEQRIYEKFFSVEEGDVVFDAGSSTGIFGYSILSKKPSQIYCIEPSQEEFETSKSNIPNDIGVFLNQGISEIDGEVELSQVYENDETIGPKFFKVSKFKTIIHQNNIQKIDFLKTDCEGGEYEIFSLENLNWLKENMSKAAGEWHLSEPEQKNKFREFRDVFLRAFPNHEIFSVDGVNIKWDLWSENFIDYYKQVIIYIDNRMNNVQILKKYIELSKIPSDINEHLETLKRYTEECEVVIEMGVRSIVSTWAFLAGGPKKLISLDLYNPSLFGGNLQEVYGAAGNAGIQFSFVEQDSLTYNIDSCDLLFLDTWHDFLQLKKELTRHHHNVKKYIILHDTVSYGYVDEASHDNMGTINNVETNLPKGLWPAIEEFLYHNRNWVIVEKKTNNNGLTILKRIN